MLKVKMVKEQGERLKELIKGVQEANNGKKMEVYRVYLKDYWGSKWRWLAAGRVLKKDGTPGEQTAETTWEIEL